jgi:hypothetical protein
MQDVPFEKLDVLLEAPRLSNARVGRSRSREGVPANVAREGEEKEGTGRVLSAQLALSEERSRLWITSQRTVYRRGTGMGKLEDVPLGHTLMR